MFSDNISDLEDNIYVKQNDILVKILKHLKSMRKKEVVLSSLYSVINNDEYELIDNLDIDVKISHNMESSDILGITYFDKEKFMEILDGEINELSNKILITFKCDLFSFGKALDGAYFDNVKYGKYWATNTRNTSSNLSDIK